MEYSIVSIIIPCYNGEKYIDQCIKSVYMQEWPEIQLIVVDDGSTDGSAARIFFWQKLLKKKKWVLQYVYQENGGLGAAVSRGLKEVKGQYLALLDADDRLLEGAIKKEAKYLDEHAECPLVRTNGWIVDEDHRWLFVQNENEKENTDVFTSLLEGKTMNWAGSYMLRTKKLFEFYPDRNIYPSRFGQNLQLLLPVAHHAQCAFIDEPLMEYIRRSGSLSCEKEKEKARQKAICNAEGYHDIRIHMISILDIGDEEKENWRKISRCLLYGAYMNIALEYKDKYLMRKAFMSFKKEGRRTLDVQIIYWTVVFRPFSFILRAFRKCRNIKVGMKKTEKEY